MKQSIIVLLILSMFCAVVPDSAQAGKIHPTLMGPGSIAAASDSIDVWVVFHDRGFSDDSELNRALQRAEANMLPRTKTRRLKVRTASLVDEKDLPVNVTYVQAVLRVGGRYRTVSRYINALSARVPQQKLMIIANLQFVKEIKPVAKAYRPLPRPEWAIPKPMVRTTSFTDDLDYGPSYDQLEQINVIAAHDSGYSGAGVLVCLLDTGFFTDHEALVNQTVVAEWDFINNDPETQNEPGDPDSQHNHGTYTFSALGGAHEGDLYGPAYGASFLIGKTEALAFELPIEEDWYVAGLEWADSIGAQVVSTSLGYFDWYTFEDMDGSTAVTTIGVDIAVANGIVCATAAGNERNSAWGHIIAPADADSVITVGAVNSAGELAGFSSPGPTYDGRIKPEVCARGVATWCAYPEVNVYGEMGGTSLATPLVGGSCALVLEAHPDWTPMQVREALMMTADNAQTPNNDYGWGIIDVMAAIDYNFPPVIIQRHPLAGTIIAFIDTTQDFWVSVDDYEGDRLFYRWYVDSQEIQTGGDSTFEYTWSESGLYTVSVSIEDTHSGSDSTSWSVQVEAATGIVPVDLSGIPQQYDLKGVYPNPFNPTTTITFDLPHYGAVKLQVFDLSGKMVADLIDENIPAGRRQLTFDASAYASGIYFLKFSAKDYQAVTKMVLLK
ncbi:hypothetical protein CEE37_03500 [candidate division LCP-89 bacterium B3_LCP]|uniref:PKD domain-containing protein n=1 Tax=candidate division LCP-89 bacterium B3_LCP TaxID=2012998 RepID=A0A532V385_UNCL8|nr:MAG: hypothetical protein CEE37_03500 [candidate division LCP-89 bacterium B3_LCP]